MENKNNENIKYKIPASFRVIRDLKWLERLDRALNEESFQEFNCNEDENCSFYLYSSKFDIKIKFKEISLQEGNKLLEKDHVRDKERFYALIDKIPKCPNIEECKIAQYVTKNERGYFKTDIYSNEKKVDEDIYFFARYGFFMIPYLRDLFPQSQRYFDTLVVGNSYERKILKALIKSNGDFVWKNFWSDQFDVQSKCTRSFDLLYPMCFHRGIKKRSDYVKICNIADETQAMDIDFGQ